MITLKQIEYISEQLFERGNLDIIDSFFDIEYRAHNGDKIHKGQNFIKKYIKQLRIAIPDITIHKIEILSNTENIITWQRTFIGTHTSTLQGIPASNKKIKWNEIVVTHFKDDKITEDWMISNLAFELMIHQPKNK